VFSCLSTGFCRSSQMVDILQKHWRYCCCGTIIHLLVDQCKIFDLMQSREYTPEMQLQCTQCLLTNISPTASGGGGELLYPPPFQLWVAFLVLRRRR